MSNQLRMRDKCAVKRLQLPKDKQEKLNMILSPKRKKFYTVYTRDRAIKSITGRCVVCDNIPSFEVIYDIQDATRKERYCDSCIKKVYAREQVL